MFNNGLPYGSGLTERFQQIFKYIQLSQLHFDSMNIYFNEIATFRETQCYRHLNIDI